MDLKEWKNDSVSISVDYDKCMGHGECAGSCPGEVYIITDGKAVAEHIDQCVECCTCVTVCPEGAITHSECD